MNDNKMIWIENILHLLWRNFGDVTRYESVKNHLFASILIVRRKRENIPFAVATKLTIKYLGMN